MTRIMVWGTSDDLIEVSEVNGYPDEFVHLAELGAYGTSEESPGELHFSDGTILHVWYGVSDLAIWRVEIAHRGSAEIVIVPAESEDGIYSETAFVTGPGLKCEKFSREGQEDEDL
ncbi:MAG: hypothetical protein WC343_11335 [Bacilli bacterium]|jgi:hypothetical protein